MADGGRKSRRDEARVMFRRVGGLISSVRRMTPKGDVVRAWIAVLASMGVIFFFPLDLESGAGWTMFYLALYDVLCVVWLGLIWLSLKGSSAEETRQWAQAQEMGGILRQRALRSLYGTRLFVAKAGQFTVATIVAIGPSPRWPWCPTWVWPGPS